jgi:hypothetical protein
MSVTRLGAVDYLNARPLVYGLELETDLFALRFDVPSKCAALLHEGSIDVGMIPSIEYLRGTAPYLVVPGPGIVSDGPVASVALFSRLPIARARTIALDTSSRTSSGLVRVLCRHCRESYPPTAELVKELQLARFARLEELLLYRGTGCRHCGNTGYHGRTAVLELLTMSAEISALVMRRVDSHSIQEVAVREGMATMLDDGYLKMLQGVTSLEELLRVTREC